MKRASASLLERKNHFDFGKNWAAFSQRIDEDRLSAAITSLQALVPDLHGKSFFDIGCGSGLFSLAALRLGAKRVFAVDIDDESVATTRKVLTTLAGTAPWTAECRSVFDVSDEEFGTFDVVYSWGVLHHTGDMWRAIDQASRLVAPGGTFAFALYERTPFCAAWRVEKRLYSRAPAAIQRLIQATYMTLRGLGRIMTGRRFGKTERRGMARDLDAHDWLGGYPYESASRDQVFVFMRERGFYRVKELPTRIHLAGLLGSGCSEYVYVREAESNQ